MFFQQGAESIQTSKITIISEESRYLAIKPSGWSCLYISQLALCVQILWYSSGLITRHWWKWQTIIVNTKWTYFVCSQMVLCCISFSANDTSSSTSLTLDPQFFFVFFKIMLQFPMNNLRTPSANLEMLSTLFCSRLQFYCRPTNSVLLHILCKMVILKRQLFSVANEKYTILWLISSSETYSLISPTSNWSVCRDPQVVSKLTYWLRCQTKLLIS